MKKIFGLFLAILISATSLSAQSIFEDFYKQLSYSKLNITSGTYKKLVWVGEDVNLAVRVEIPYLYKNVQQKEVSSEEVYQWAMQFIEFELKNKSKSVINFYTTDSLIFQVDTDTYEAKMQAPVLNSPARLTSNSSQKGTVPSPAALAPAFLSKGTEAYITFFGANAKLLESLGKMSDEKDYFTSRKEKFKQLPDALNFHITYVHGKHDKEKVINLYPTVEFVEIE